MTKQKQFRVTVNNGQFDFIFDDPARSDDQAGGSQIQKLDSVVIGKNSFQILDDHQSYKAEVIEMDLSNKQIVIKVNGTLHTVVLADQYDLLVEKMGLSADYLTKVSNIKAPMPGLVLSVAVEVGQEVQEGDQLLILEAMKMENVLKSSGEGIVKEILINEGQAVDKGQLLIELE